MPPARDDTRPTAEAPVAWQVAVPVPLPRLFDYRPPAAAPVRAPVGARVRVPLGASGERVGVVVGSTPLPADAGVLKPVTALLDDTPLLHGELLESLRWLARYTHAPLGEVLATALPGPLRHGEPLPDTRTWAWRLTEAGATALTRLRAGRPRQLAEALQPGAVDEATLEARHDGWRAAARSLQGRGLVERVEVAGVDTTPVAGTPGPTTNDEQRIAIDAIRAASAGFRPLLLDGVTGSGKTEVYLQAIADCLARGKQALVLVPEIGLTPQTLARFRARLGVPVHALHSGLSDGERARTWTACLRGQARVVVGTRSAVFLPLPEAGLIVIDEEHDGSFKQLDGIRYHARDFALVRGKALGVPVVLGSATPSLESLHNATGGRYAHLRLTRRAGRAQPPRVRVVDVRKRPLTAGLSPELLADLGQVLQAGGQALVFKNRRGYAPVLLCHDCGWAAHCARCSTPERGTPMTVHAGGRRLQCHHCGARRAVPNACPDCGGLALQAQGAGTERIEEALTERFPDLPVLRIDRGTTQRRDALEQALAGFGDGPGVLVGTQMLAKGHDLPHLTRVAVVGTDEGLFSADFRAPEKLAQLLIQVAGRAGRAEKPGEVLLQTHHPEHPLLATLLSGGYPAFAAEELAQREAAGFPPFAHLALMRAEAKQLEVAHAFLRGAREALETAVNKPLSPRERGGGEGSAQWREGPSAAPPQTSAESEQSMLPAVFQHWAPNPHPHPSPERRGAQKLTLSGPLPAPMPRRAGYQRAQLLLSCPTRGPLHAALDAALPAIYALPDARRVRWSLDVDPIDLY